MSQQLRHRLKVPVGINTNNKDNDLQNYETYNVLTPIHKCNNNTQECLLDTLLTFTYLTVILDEVVNKGCKTSTCGCGSMHRTSCFIFSNSKSTGIVIYTIQLRK